MRPCHAALISIPLITLIGWGLAPFILDLHEWNVRGAAVFLGIGLVYPALVTTLTYEANRLMGPAVTGGLGNLAPLFALVGAAILLGELPRPLELAGIAAIICGVTALSLQGATSTGKHWPLWAVALPLTASLIRGAAQPLTKIGLASWPNAFAAVLLSFTVSTCVVGAIAFASHRSGPIALPREGVFWFCCVALSNGAAVLCLYAALARGPVALVAPLTATYPLATLGLSVMLLRSEKITPLVAASVAATVAGVALILGDR